MKCIHQANCLTINTEHLHVHVVNMLLADRVVLEIRLEDGGSGLQHKSFFSMSSRYASIGREILPHIYAFNPHG